jgi:hypothetical protein
MIGRRKWWNGTFLPPGLGQLLSNKPNPSGFLLPNKSKQPAAKLGGLPGDKKGGTHQQQRKGEWQPGSSSTQVHGKLRASTEQRRGAGAAGGQQQHQGAGAAQGGQRRRGAGAARGQQRRGAARDNGQSEENQPAVGNEGEDQDLHGESGGELGNQDHAQWKERGPRSGVEVRTGALARIKKEKNWRKEEMERAILQVIAGK